MGLLEVRASRRKWPAKQRRLLRKLHNEGFTPREIHAFELLGDPPRSFWSIRKQWGRLRLADRDRARQMRKKKIWAPGEKKQFDAYLREHSGTMTPEQIGREWGVARSTVARRQNELNVKRSRDEVMAMEYSQAKQRRARRRIRRSSQKHWEVRRQKREESLFQLADELRAQDRRPAEAECIECGRVWPKRSEFFHSTEKKISIGRSRYFKQRCRLCENARRRERSPKRKRKRSTATNESANS